MTKVTGLNQNQFAEKAGISWHQVSRLAIRGIIKPIADIGGRLIFSPDDAPKAAEAIKQFTADEEAKFRPDWDALSTKERAEFGDFKAYVAFKKNERYVESYQNGRSARAVGRIGGAR